MSENKSLRSQIDAYRRERAIFDEIYGKLESQLAKRKEEIAKMINEANDHYEKKQGYKGKIQQKRQETENERKRFEHNLNKVKDAVSTEMRGVYDSRVRFASTPQVSAKGNTDTRQIHSSMSRSKQSTPFEERDSSHDRHSRNVISPEVKQQLATFQEEELELLKMETNCTDNQQVEDLFRGLEEKSFKL